MKNPTSERIRPRRRLMARPHIEALEDRTLLAAAVAALFDPVQVNVGINHDPVESKPEVGVAADGSFNVAFLQVPSGGGATKDLYVRRYNADGTPKAFHTILVTSGTVADPQIAVRDDGSFTVAYVSNLGGLSTIFIGLYAADGAKLAGPKRVAAGIEPDIAVRNSDGSLVVVWVGNPTGNPFDYGVYGQGFDANGNPLAPAFPVVTSFGVKYQSPSVAIRQGMVLSGETALVISYVTEIAIFNEIWVKRYGDLTGTGIGDLIHANTSQGYQGQAAVAIDSAGDFVTTWAYFESPKSWVKFRTFDSDGVPHTPDEQFVGNIDVLTDTPGQQSQPSVAMAEDGHFIIAFLEGTGTSSPHVAFQQFRDNGIPVAGEREVSNHGPNKELNPSIGANGTGTFAIADDDNVIAGDSAYEPWVRAFRQMPRAQFAVASAGKVELRRISDNQLVSSFSPYGDDYHGGLSLAFGDLNGDGIDNLVIGGIDGPHHVLVHGLGNGADVQNLFSVGAFVASGDVNGDGFDDIVAGASVGNPHVTIVAGNGLFDVPFHGKKKMANFFAYQTGFNIGVSVAVGEINGDDYDDVATGAVAGNPHVRVFDGEAIALGNFTFDPATNPGANQLANPNFFPFGLNFNVGVYVAIGDIHGDGGDLIVGASRGNPDVRVYKNADVLNPAFNPQVDPPANSFFANTLNQDIGVPVAALKLHGEDPPADILVGVINGPTNWRAVKGTTNGGPIPPSPVEVNGVKFEGIFGLEIGSVFVGG